MSKPFTKAEVETFFARLKKIDPAPRTELEYTNPYTLLVAVALSAQATDKGVNKATKALFQKISTPQQMLALGEEKLTDAIKTMSCAMLPSAKRPSRSIPISSASATAPGWRRARMCWRWSGRWGAWCRMNMPCTPITG